jgi:predicted nucleic acid-binding protein
MSPLKRPVVLDNDVISRLYSAGALRRALEVWPKRSFCVTDYVVEEARRWPAKGQGLVALVKELEAEEILAFISIDGSSEEEVWAYARLQLAKRLGRGESASIAIACHRGFDIATDDGVAADTCRTMSPSVAIFGTGALLNMAVRDGLTTRDEANAIQARIRRAMTTT